MRRRRTPDPRALADRVRALAESGRVEEALALLEARHRADPSSVDVMILLAVELIGRDRSRAAALLEGAVATAPEDAGVLARCAQVLVALREWDAARALLDRLERVEPEGFPLAADAEFLRGQTAAGLGDWEPACATSRSPSTHLPSSTTA